MNISHNVVLTYEVEAAIAVKNLRETNFEIYVTKNSFLIRLSPQMKLRYLSRCSDSGTG